MTPKTLRAKIDFFGQKWSNTTYWTQTDVEWCGKMLAKIDYLAGWERVASESPRFTADHVAKARKTREARNPQPEMLFNHG
jgi:hypothetical protein